jgi:hypothetical protein
MRTSATRGEATVLEQAGSGELIDLGELPEDERVLNAEFVRDLILETEDGDPRGLRIAGASILGRLDLEFCRIERPLWLRETEFEQRPCFDRCSIPHLSLSGCRLAGLDANELRVDFDLDLSDVQSLGPLVISRARIAGQLICDRASIVNVGGAALLATYVQIGSSAYLGEGFRAMGSIVLLGATLGGNLECDGAILTSTGLAFVADGATIRGDVLMREGFAAAGCVRLQGARVEGDVAFDGATLTNGVGWALLAEGVDIRGDLRLRDGFNATGGVDLSGARLGGRLECDGAKLANERGWALEADGVDVGGGVHLRDGFSAIGGVFLLGGSIGGHLACSGATLTNEGGWALIADDARIGGGALLGDGFAANGGVRLLGTNVGTSLDLTAASLAAEDGWALVADDAEIGGPFILSDATIAGGLSVFNASCTTLSDDVGPERGLGSWAGADPLRLEGFAYDRFGGGESAWSTNARFSWLEQTPSFDPGSWQRLRDLYRAQGRDADARRTAIAMENDRLKRGNLSPLRKAGRWILRITIGHGYRSWLAVVWAVAIVVPFALLVWLAPADTFVPTGSAAAGSPQPLIYSLDTFLPIVDLGEADQWTVTGSLRWAAWTVILLGWALSTIFVAGFTRIVRSV